MDATCADTFSKQPVHRLHLALRTHARPSPAYSRPQNRLTERQVVTALRLIEKHLASKLSTSQLSEACHVSRAHFSRAFKVTFGETPHRFLLMRRIELARTFLEHSGDTLADIAVRCGFNDQPHFTRVFKILTGQTPSAWRQMQRA